MRRLSALAQPSAAHLWAVRESTDARRGCSASAVRIASRWCQFTPSDEHNAMTLPNGMGQRLSGARTILGAYRADGRIASRVGGHRAGGE